MLVVIETITTGDTPPDYSRDNGVAAFKALHY